MRYTLKRATPGRAAIFAAVCIAATLGSAGLASAERADAPPADIPVAELMKPTDLPDIGIGNPDAKVTVIEYSSLTCPHCAHFATTVFPAFKTAYIDTNKVRFITREFPLDNVAAAASMLARCMDKDKAFAFIDTMFATQESWAHTEGSPIPKLMEIAKQAGFTKETFEKCLTDQVLLDKILAARKRAGETLQVNSTPSFFVNGKRVTGVNTVADFAKVIDPMLDAAVPAEPAKTPDPAPEKK